MTAMKTRIGDMNRVSNKGKKFGAAPCYMHVRVQQADGTEEHLLFTEHQVEQARRRAAKNPEDLVKPSFLRDLVD